MMQNLLLTKTNSAIFTLTILLIGSSTFIYTNNKHSVSNIEDFESPVAACIQALPKKKRSSHYESIVVQINTDLQKDIILKETDTTYCNKFGCAYELCLITNTSAEIIPFGYTAKRLVVKNTHNNGLYDIQLLGEQATDLQWDGNQYIISGHSQITEPAEHYH